MAWKALTLILLAIFIDSFAGQGMIIEIVNELPQAVQDFRIVVCASIEIFVNDQFYTSKSSDFASKWSKTCTFKRPFMYVSINTDTPRFSDLPPSLNYVRKNSLSCPFYTKSMNTNYHVRVIKSAFTLHLTVDLFFSTENM